MLENKSDLNEEADGYDLSTFSIFVEKIPKTPMGHWKINKITYSQKFRRRKKKKKLVARVLEMGQLNHMKLKKECFFKGTKLLIVESKMRIWNRLKEYDHQQKKNFCES